MFIYLKDAAPGKERDDLALLVEEVLKQRIYGIKNIQGALITPAFPKILFVLDDNNMFPDSDYYYLRELAAKCTAVRMVPDYISEKKMLEHKGDVYGCMGCVDGDQVISYKLFGKNYTESFKRAWFRLGQYYPDKKQSEFTDDLYKDTPGVQIWDSEKTKYVECHRIIRNNSKNWLELTFSNGRVLDCTPDHPFETQRGVVKAEDLTSEDVIKADKTSSNLSAGTIPFNNDKAWLLGFILCDGCYKDHVSVTTAFTGEDDIQQNFIEKMSQEYDYMVQRKEQHRDKKGDYVELNVIPDSNKSIAAFTVYLKSLFDGTAKSDRHIPNEVFDWDENARLAFLAGMIDADGYINNNVKLCKVQIGSTNKELAIQQMLLAQSLGMPACIYRNHYNSNHKDKIRYRVEFVPTDTLVSYIVSDKKRSHMTNNIRTNDSVNTEDTIQLINKVEYTDDKFSYDVTTDSEHFTVSGIYSHNCRSFLTPDRFTDAGVGNIANAKNYVPGKHRYWGRFNQGVVTLNLVDVALSSKKDLAKFWELLDERLELCHRALRLRHERLLGTPSDIAPILFQHGAIARLKSGEVIDPLLYDGYSTISLGYAGLYEMCYYMTGKSHTDEEAKPFALSVMQKLNDACAKWKTAENIDYSVYGTPQLTPRGACIAICSAKSA